MSLGRRVLSQICRLTCNTHKNKMNFNTKIQKRKKKLFLCLCHLNFIIKEKETKRETQITEEAN